MWHVAKQEENQEKEISVICEQLKEVRCKQVKENHEKLVK